MARESQKLDDDYYDERESLPEEVANLRRLWAASMLGAIRDYTAYIAHKGAARKAYKNDETARVAQSKALAVEYDGELAKRWIYRDTSGPGTFIWVCEVLGLDPERVRVMIERNWRQVLDATTHGNERGCDGKRRRVVGQLG